MPKKSRKGEKGLPPLGGKGGSSKPGEKAYTGKDRGGKARQGAASGNLAASKPDKPVHRRARDAAAGTATHVPTRPALEAKKGAPRSPGQAGAGTPAGTGARAGAWLNLRNVVFLGVLVLLFYPPYFRGLFFPREQLITHIYTTVLFALWWTHKLRRGDGTFLRGPMDYAALGLLGSYLLSTLVAVNIRGAIGEDLKYINYFMLYWLLSELVRDAVARAPAKDGSEAGYRVIRIILNVMLASAVGVAVLGIGAAAGTFRYNGAFIDGRIASSIQYPNSLAAYLMAAFFVGLGMWLYESRWWGKALYAGACYLLFLTFIFTLSRGAWLVFPVAFALLLVVLPRGFRLPAALFLVAVLVPLPAVVHLFARALANKAATQIWVLALAGVPVAVAASIVAVWFMAQPVRRKVAVAAGLLAVMVVAGGAVAWTLLHKPLTFTHRPDEGDSWKYYDQKVAVKPGTAYELEVEVNATAVGDKPYAWGISVFVPAKGDLPAKTLLSLRGKATGGLVEQKGKFEAPADTGQVTVRLYSYYAGTSAAFGNVSVSEADKPADVKVLMFITSRILPQGLIQRIGSIGMSEFSAWSRLRWMVDALKIVRDRPFLGAGGRGWSSLYFKYQSYGYWSTEVHNHFIQTWVETGTLGFLAFLALWATFLAATWQGVRQGQGKERALMSGLPVGALALGMHSFIDFNLSLSAISFYLWSLWGLTSSNPVAFSSSEAGRRRDRWTGPWPGAVMAFAVAGAYLASALILLAGFNYGQQGAKFLAEKDPARARETFERARAYDPFTASFRIDLAQIYEVVGNQQRDASLVSQARKELDEGIRLEPYNPNFNAFRGAFYLRNGQVEEGLASLERAVKLQPFQEKHYANLAQAYLVVGRSYLERKQGEKAGEYLAKAAAVPARLREVAGKIPPQVPTQQRVKVDHPTLALAAGEAMVLLGEADEAEALLKLAVKDKETTSQAQLWLGILYEQQGQDSRGKQYLQKAWAANPSLRAEYQRVQSLLGR